MTSGLPRKDSGLQRVTALAASALILVLGILASSPDLHAWLHSHEHGAATSHETAHSHSHPFAPDGLDDDDGCAVTLFAQGVIAALGIVSIKADPVALHTIQYLWGGVAPSCNAVFAHARAMAPPPLAG